MRPAVRHFLRSDSRRSQRARRSRLRSGIFRRGRLHSRIERSEVSRPRPSAPVPSRDRGRRRRNRGCADPASPSGYPKFAVISSGKSCFICVENRLDQDVPVVASLARRTADFRRMRLVAERIDPLKWILDHRQELRRNRSMSSGVTPLSASNHSSRSSGSTS